MKEKNVEPHKIDKLPSKIYSIVSADFSFGDKLRQIQFFKKICLIANISMEVILEMLFILLINTYIEFAETEEVT